jgi:RNA binding exosome subunit
MRPLAGELGIQSVRISTIAHATDDLDKVQRALRFILPESLKTAPVFTRANLEGHHGNPIVTFDAKLTKHRDVDQFAAHFLSQIPKDDRLSIKRNLDAYTDEEGNLFVRVSKQQAFRGIVELGEEDPIRIKVKFNRFSGDPKNLMIAYLESA